jgi:GntR family transcriptional regulator
VVWEHRLRVDPAAVTPLYYQLKEQLRAVATRMEAGAAIPSEKELMQLTGVGRATVRKAVADLVQEGVLYTQQGRGTFTAPRRIETSLERPAGFTETMRRLGRRPSTQLLKAELAGASAFIAGPLRLEVGAPIYVIERLRLIDDEPCMVERTHMPVGLLPDLLQHDLTTSLYELLAATYQVQPATGTETIVAVNADRHLAQLLGVPIASALIATIRQTRTRADQPLEYTIRHARGDLLSFRVTLSAAATLSDIALQDHHLLVGER